MKIGVLGAGAWGTALARCLHQNGHAVSVWGHDGAHLAAIHSERRNESHLPGIVLDPSIVFTPHISEVGQSDVIVVAVPSKALREVTTSLASFGGTVVSVTKGIEFDSGLTMSGVLRQTMPNAAVGVLSGPTLALEVAKDIPSAIVAAAEQNSISEQIQSLFHRPTFRVYTSADVLGVELGGALKNVIAIGAGVCDGLGFGDNSKAALITRAIVEIRRLGTACGAQSETFSGLSGLGDLTVTCFSKLSRNRMFGERLGRGETVLQIQQTSNHVAEGFPTARSAFQLARKLNVVTPIIDEVHAMLHEGKDVRRAVRDLTGRDSKAE